MNYITLAEAMEQIGWEGEIDPMSVYRACEQVEDRRHKRGVRYSVALILTLLVLGKAMGMTSLQGIAEWVRLRANWLAVVLPITHKRFPCAATYSNVLRAVDAEQVRQVFTDLLLRVEAAKRAEEEPSRLTWQEEGKIHEHVALDGKTLRGTLGHTAADQAKMHQLGLYETQTGLLLKEAITGEKQNELSLVSDFLTPQLLSERIISADALHTQHHFCFTVRRWEGHYVLVAKANQPTLAEDLRLFFDEPPADCRDWRQGRTVEKGHGRLEIRELIASTELNDFLASDWAGVAQVFQLTRTVIEDGQTRREVVYGISSLSPAQASPERLLDLVRAHWAIENRLHWRRDVTLREDHSQVRTTGKPETLAALNNIVLALMDWLGVHNVPEQMRIFQAFPALALALLLGPLTFE